MTVHRIALDIARTGFTETYRIGAFHGVIQYARRHTNWRLFYNVPSFSLVDKFEEYEDLVALGASGIIFSHWSEEKLDRIRRIGVPAVSISNDEPECPYSCIVTDDLEVGRSAAEHFLERGYHSFGFCGSEWVPWETARRRGFEEILRGHGLACSSYRDEPVDSPQTDIETAAGMAQWVRELPKPVGILGADDTRALHVLEACLAEGIRVPEQVGIVGVDDNRLICESLLPSLSSVEQNTQRVGWEAAALLDRLLAGETIPPRVVEIPPRGIVTRMSSDIAAVEDPALAQALVFIRDHLGDPLNVPAVARAAGISRSALEKRFRARLHTTVNGAIRRQRLAKAKTLLIESTLTIQEIADATGFRRATYFCNAFKDDTGMSPGTWRAKHLRSS
ncbi:substrate-binding domain-containing protein [bacterium]|nr:substrate-binding domain-containing protein [bacterium]